MTKKLNFLNVLKKEFFDFIYSYKSVLTVFIVILGEKLILHVNKPQPYDIFFHSWLITTALQQFVYDSFLTDIREKGLLFYQNMKVSFKQFFAAKFLICVVLYLFMFLCEINNILRDANIQQFFCLSLQGFIAMPLMFIASTVFIKSETGGLIITTLIMAVIIFGLRFISQLWISYIITIILLAGFVFLAYSVYKSLFFKKQL